MKLLYSEGAIPLNPDEVEGLLPNIRLQSELNTREEVNIVGARRWAYSPRNKQMRQGLLSIEGLVLLHRKMFEDVWKWAGILRRTEKSIGVDPYQISTHLYQLCQDVKAQVFEYQSYSLEECAIRFHHRLVQIHPFANGNGRHARLACDLLLHLNGAAAFTWGSGKLTENGETRNVYLKALRQADRGDVMPLLSFAKG